MAEASGKSRAADEILRVKRIFVFDRTNHNRNESRRDFRRATRPIHRNNADEWEKAPAMGAFGTLVGYTRLSARGVRAFSRRSAERSRTCGSATATVLSVILRMQNLFFICPTSRREHIRRVGKSTRNGCFWYTRRELNPNLRLRRPPFYPLYYECGIF